MATALIASALGGADPASATVSNVVVSTVVGATGAVGTSASAALVTQKPDTWTAGLAARSQGLRVEDLSARTESSQTFANPDGSFTTESTFAPVRTRGADGEWRDLNSTLHPLPGGGVGPTVSLTDVVFADGTAKSAWVPLVRLGSGADAATWLWHGHLPAPVISGSTATYVDALPGADVVLEATRSGFEQSVVLRRRPTRALAIPLAFAAGSNARATSGKDGSVALTDAAGGKVGSVLPASMWDATQNRNDLAFNPRPVASQLLTAGSTSTNVGLPLTDPIAANELGLPDSAAAVSDVLATAPAGARGWVWAPDRSFLADPATVYPVTVDPSVTLGDTFDTYVQSNQSGSYATSTQLKLGALTSTVTSRAFLQFDTHFLAADATRPAATVSSATLSLWNWNTPSCTARQWQVWLSGAVNSSTVWSNQPATVGPSAWATPSGTLGYSAACAAGWVSANTTSLMQNIANNGYGISTLELKAGDESDLGAWKQLHSAEGANPPKMSVTYNRPPTTPEAPSITPFTGGFVNTVTPTLSDIVSDPDGQPVTARFNVTNQAVTTSYWEQTTSSVASGGTASALVDGSAKLVDGGTYQARVQVSDGTAAAPWSPLTQFTVDTTSPGAPSVSSSTWPAGQWTAQATGSIGWTAPSADTVSYRWSLDGGSFTSTTSTSVTFANLRDGLHDFKVQAVDHANNVGAASTTYSFAIGSDVGMASPKDGDRTQRYVTLGASAASAGQYGHYQYQVGTAGGWTDIPGSQLTTPGSSTHPADWFAVQPDATFPPFTWDTTIPTTPKIADGLVQLRACVSTSVTGSSPVCRSTVGLQINRTAFGGSYATAPIGPGTVSLATGDFSVASSDASVAGLSLARSFTTLAPSTATSGNKAIFGPGWVSSLPDEAGDSDLSIDDHAAQGFVNLVDSDGGVQTYQQSAPNTFTGIGDAADGSVLTAGPGTYTLKTTDGVVTTWTLSGTTWRVTSVAQPGTDSASSYHYNAQGLVDTITAPSPDGVDCVTGFPAGCRALQLTYDTNGRVTQVSYRGWDPATGTVTSVPVQKYSYAGPGGRLDSVWDPRISPTLLTAYQYDANGRVNQVASPGQTPWVLEYDTTSSTPGRLVAVERTTPQGVEARTKLVYDVNIDPTAGGPAALDLRASALAKWNQTSDLPVSGTAVIPANWPMTKTGSIYQPTATDWPYASITYMDVNGRAVNTASYGAGAWQISSDQYDSDGNVTWSLPAGNRAEALNPSTVSNSYIRGLTEPGARADALATQNVYSTDGAGDLLTTTGPVQDMVLNSGTTAAARLRTTNTYDEGKPDPTLAYHLLTTSRTGPVDPSGATLGSATDARTTKTGYNPLDGTTATSPTSGWTLHQPTTTTTVMGSAGLPDIVRGTVYDASGRVTQTRQPSEPTGGGPGTTLTTYYSAAATAATCNNRPQWVGMVCTVGPAAQPATGNPLPVTTTTYTTFDQPLTTTETSGSTTRTTTTGYDPAGRPTTTTTAVAGAPAGDQPVPDTTTTYSATTGRVTAVASTAGTITTSYDALGQVTSRTDATGNTATTTYDPAGRPTTNNDGKGTTTYTYDTAAEHRGLVTSMDVGIGNSIPSTITSNYDAFSALTTTTYPNGVTKTVDHDIDGHTRNQTYKTSDGTTIASWAQAFSPASEVRYNKGPSAAGTRTQNYGYDPAGRLNIVYDTRGTTCTQRRYYFDANSNRTTKKTWTDGTSTCPASSTTPSTTSTPSIDTADRITSNTVTGAGASTGTYAYDNLGRTRTLPAIDTASTGADLALTYCNDDLVATQTKTTTGDKRTYTYDTDRRINTWTDTTSAGTATGATRTYHYADETDSPAWIDEGNSTWTRNIHGPEGDLAIVATGNGTTAINAALEVTSPHGDITTTIPLTVNVTPTAVAAATDTDEYGNTIAGSTSRYTWLGSKSRTTDSFAGLIIMGVRQYSPFTGRFLTVDPIFGGNESAYGYPADPINYMDSTGGMIAPIGGNGGKCAALLKEIIRRKNALGARARQLKENKNGWAEGSPKRLGHVNRFKDEQQGLRKLLREWDRCGCGGPGGYKAPKNIWKIASRDWQWVAKSTAAAGVIFGLWLGAKWFSPACGPAMPACFLVF